MNRTLVVLETPYRSDPEIYSIYLKHCIRDSLDHNESPISSVATFCLTGALYDKVFGDRQIGISAGLEWYRVAAKCVVYEDHGISPGMVLGIAAAERAGVPVEYRRLLGDKEDSVGRK